MRKAASRDISSASVELCETEVCFLHIQLIGTNDRLPKMHRIPPDFDFESSMSPAKSESCNYPESALLCCVSHTAIVSVTCVMNVRELNAPNVCRMLLSIL